jgi:hypothetical protein
MSYEPTLIIRKKDLDKILPILEDEQYSDNPKIEEVALYLLQTAKYEIIKFDDLELVSCTPETSNFNYLVRKRLLELSVDYREV